MEDIDVVDIDIIMKMLDWNMPLEIQRDGIALASNIDTVTPFIQPLTLEHNKNVWENCALIITEKTDEKLRPYLVHLLEWIQDMNWPGASCVLNRLEVYADKDSLESAVCICIEKAKKCNDEVWMCNLNSLLITLK